MQPRQSTEFTLPIETTLFTDAIDATELVEKTLAIPKNAPTDKNEHVDPTDAKDHSDLTLERFRKLFVFSQQPSPAKLSNLFSMSIAMVALPESLAAGLLASVFPLPAVFLRVVGR